MHPLDHLIYLSNVLIHILFASHPIHIFFHLQWNAIGAGVSHTGYESLTVRGKPLIYLSPFHHQLQHRLYNCNYGNSLVPMPATGNTAFLMVIRTPSQSNFDNVLPLRLG